MIKITHIFHSGFSVELEQNILIFDWYQGNLPDFPAGKKLFVFVSHEHADHYGSCIWSLPDKYADVSYIFDEDVAPERRDVLHVQARNQYRLGDLQIQTLLSTDEGVAFNVTVEGHTIYHSGDLNIWSWEADSEQRNRERREIYRKEISVLQNNPPEIAFVPLDPRLGKNATDALAAYLETLDSPYVFPMHYWSDQAKVAPLIEEPPLAEYKDRIHFEDESIIS